MIKEAPRANNEIQGMAPIKELITQDGYRWFVYSEEDMGLRLVCLEDLQTGVVVTTTVANPQLRVAAHRAWAGARHSRAPGMPWEIMRDMGQKGVDPDQKLEETFKTYGHASVGDMAREEVDIVCVPMHACLVLFNQTAINSGQEKSTRYQPRFGKAVLHPIANYLPEHFDQGELNSIEQAYQNFGMQSLELFAKHKELLTPAFEEFFRLSDDSQRGSLNSRVLDCVRYFLLFGQTSGQSVETSARDWSRMIGELKASPIRLYRRIGSQIEKLLSPTREEEIKLGYLAESPGLIRHAEPANTVNANIARLKQYLVEETTLLYRVLPRQNVFRGQVQQGVELLSREYTEGERLMAQYLLLLWPGMDTHQVLNWVHEQDNTTKKEMSKIVFNDHNNYRELPIWSGVTSQTIIMQSFLGELRDFNRHRGQRRFISLPLVFGESWDIDTAYQVTAKGFGLPLYLTEIPQFNHLKNEFESDLKEYYQALYKFARGMHNKYGNDIDYCFVLNLLPLAHQVDLWMHGDPKQALYFTNQRSRPGGHINYRKLAFEANRTIANSDPCLSGLQLEREPDPSDASQFFDRS